MEILDKTEALPVTQAPVEKSAEQRVAECIAELDAVLRKHRCGMRAAARQRTDLVGDGSGLLVKAETKIEVVPLP